ncbi:MAG: PAS domain S-box protein [Deltaproteobacteria bacterium]|nr:PAS domain S-box protein [Deltaproteobacteria bacterium]
MSSSQTGKLSLKEKGLRYKLFIIEALIFVLPFLVISYIFYRNNVFFEFSQIIILALVLIFILAGLIIPRQIFNRFLMVANSIKKAESGDKFFIDTQKDTAELREITVSFNNLMKKFEETTGELRRRGFELFAIKELTEVASKSLDTHDLLSVLLEKAMAVSRAQIGSVFMVESQKGRFRIVASRGLQWGPKKDSYYIDINKSLARHVVSDKKPLLVQNIETDPRTQKPNDPKYGPPSFLSMPIFIRENLIAVLNLSHKETKQVFGSNDEHILSIMIGEIGFALENAQLHLTVDENLKNLQERTVELTNANDKLKKEINKRKRAEEAFQESDKKYQAILESMEEGYYEIDIVGNLTFFNESLCKILGYSRDELLGMNNRDYTNPETARRMYQIFNQIYRTEKPARVTDYEIIRKDGTTRVLELSASLMRDNGDKPIGFRGVVRDVSQRLWAEREKRKLEAQLQQAQKMEAIGTLAGGITHDFNNILAAIIGYTELAMLDVQEGSKAKQRLKEVQKAGNRAKDLVNQILTFSRQSKQELLLVQIRPIVKEALKLLRASLPTTIEIHQKLESDLGTVEADPTKLHQVLMNLCTNAAHAMRENGGILEVSLTKVDMDADAAARHRDIRPGPYLKLTVSDTGHGMAPEVLERIFDPYFTTKEKGKGTGLGLSVVHGIVKDHRGAITVESELGKGTTFHILLPRMDHAKEVAVEPESRLGIPTGHERILFIDDEQVLVDLGKQMLELLGYEVITRTSSIEALELFRAQPNKFDLVITDMTMPNMTGEKLAKELMKIRPNIPIILCTGFSEQITEKESKEIGIREFAMKPLVMRDLAKSIRKVLAEKVPL